MLSRRGLLGATASTGLVVAFHIPLAGVATAQDVRPAEVNTCVVVKPDDSSSIRIAMSEMGQGTLTDLADARVWGDFGKGGSRGICASHDYVRKSGAGCG